MKFTKRTWSRDQLQTFWSTAIMRNWALIENTYRQFLTILRKNIKVKKDYQEYTLLTLLVGRENVADRNVNVGDRISVYEGVE